MRLISVDSRSVDVVPSSFGVRLLLRATLALFAFSVKKSQNFQPYFSPTLNSDGED